MLFLFFFIKTFIIRKDAGKKTSTGPIFFAVPSHYLLVMLWSKLSWTFDVGTMKLWPLKNSSRGRKGWKDHWYAKFKLSITIWVEMYFDGICCILFSKHTLDWEEGYPSTIQSVEDNTMQSFFHFSLPERVFVFCFIWRWAALLLFCFEVFWFLFCSFLYYLVAWSFGALLGFFGSGFLIFLLVGWLV